MKSLRHPSFLLVGLLGVALLVTDACGQETPDWWFKYAAQVAQNHDGPGSVKYLLEVAEAQLHAGDVSGAHETAYLAFQATLRTRMQAIQVARFMSKLGDHLVALKACTFAREISSREGGVLSVDFLCDIAIAYIEAGDRQSGRDTLRKALALARGIESKEERNYTLERLAIQIAATGDDALVDSIAPDILRIETRAKLRFRLALAQADARNYAAARKNSAIISQWNSGALAEIVEIHIARRQIDRQSFADAKATISALAVKNDLLHPGVYYDVNRALDRESAASVSGATKVCLAPRAFLLVELACASYSAGDADAARETMVQATQAAKDSDLPYQKRDWVHARDKLLRIIVETQLEHGELTAAKAILNEVFHPWEKVVAYLAVAKAEKAKGNVVSCQSLLQAAIDTAEMCDSHEDQRDRQLLVAQAATELSERQYAMASLRKADETLATLLTHVWVSQMCRILPIRRIAGDEPGFRNSLNVAIGRAESIDDAKSRGWAYQEIAQTMIDGGDVNGARKLAHQIEDIDTRSSVRAQVAIALADRGELDDAKGVAAMIDVDDDRSRAYHAIATTLAKRGDANGATLLLDKITNSSNNYYSRMAVAKAFARAGRFKESHEMAAPLVAQWPGDEKVYAELAELQAVAGDLAGLRAWVESLTKTSQIVFVCTGAARGLIEREKKKGKIGG